MQRKFRTLSDRIRAAEESRNFNHIPGSEHIHKELRTGTEKLFEIGGLNPDMHNAWQESVLRLQDKLEAQKQHQRRDEDIQK